MIGQNVQLVHLRAGVQHHQLVLWNVGRCCCKVCDGFALHALEVHVPALTLLLLPGHADEGPLHVVVDDLGPTARPFLHLFFVSGISYKIQFSRIKFSDTKYIWANMACIDQ